MEFEEFSKKIGDHVSPEEAYKLYLHVKVNLIEEILLESTSWSRKDWDKMESRILEKVAEKLKK